jgi:subtilisin family serine protease
VRIAHIDTGYDPGHATLPKFLRSDLQRNFVEDGSPNDATDHTTDVLTNLGHGTGTLAILAGGGAGENPIGGAPNQDVIPIRVANSIAQFRTSAVVRAFDYVHGLFKNPRTRAHVISMSLGGFASQVWAEAINALYDSGVFIVTAAGNNFGNLPTRNIVFPARFPQSGCCLRSDGKSPALCRPGAQYYGWQFRANLQNANRFGGLYS